MRPAWRLAINSLSARPSRSALLVMSVLLSAALIAAVSCSMASVHASLRARVESTVGKSDLRVVKLGKDLFPLDTTDTIRAWPESRVVVPRLRDALALENPRTGKKTGLIGNGVDPRVEFDLRPLVLKEGRGVSAEHEIVLDERAADLLEARVGDVLHSAKRSTTSGAIGAAIANLIKPKSSPASGSETPAPAASAPTTPASNEPGLTVVGISKQPSIGVGVVLRAEGVLAYATLRELTGRGPLVSEIDVILKPGSDATALAQARQSGFTKGILLRPSAKVTSGLEKNIRQSQIGMTIASVLAYLAASFIILTGLTTNVTERQRELAMLRCIGASRWQMAESQLVTGMLIGLCGALLGVPLGMVGSLILVKSFPEQLPGGFQVNAFGLIMAVLGSLGAGIVGAAWPAWRAARTSPLEALAIRSKPARTIVIFACGLIGIALVSLQLLLIFGQSDPDRVFWSELTVGLPAMFTGYFIMAVPVFWIVARVLGPVLSKVMRLPANLLTRTVLATPYRFGFTAGAMMMGLALLVSIWTNGRAVLEDWLKGLKFPDAFVAGVAITDEARQRIAALPFVTETVALQTLPLKTRALGISAFDNTSTTFIAFEPEPFFRMTSLTWVQGSPEFAIPKLNAGGAVLVAKEFQTARGIKLGDKITLEHEDKPYEFEVVGVVSSPGLDIVNSWFEIGEDYAEQAVNAVFGTRADMKRLFGVDSIRLLQVGLKPDKDGIKFDDAEAVRKLREVGGTGVLDAGSGRQILEEVTGFLSASLYIFSLVAVGAMLVACFGVANLVVAGIQARRFEFGVLRAVGAQRGLLARLVLGEAMLIAISACLLGTVMGMHGARAGQRMNEVIIGLSFRGWPPIGPTLAGWAVVTVITLGAAAPAILMLNRAKVRELLGGVRG